MQTVWMLTKRNMKIYMRNRSLVFFSLLSILIMIMLNIFFLQKMNVDNVTAQFGTSKLLATVLVSSLTLAGIIFTSTITVTLAVIGLMIQDEDQKRMMAFVVAPISRLQLSLGYITAAFLMGCILSLVTLAISQGYILFIGGTLLPTSTLLRLIGVLIVTVFSNACMMFFFATLVRSSSSFSVLNTIVGTLIGFVAGIYLPMGMLPEFVQNALKFYPGLYGASLIRETYVGPALDDVFALLPLEALEAYSSYMGITLTWGSYDINPLCQLLILIGSGILFIILSALVLKKKKGTDR